MKQKIIALGNHKGGTGKTTLSREIGIYLSSAGKITLLVDIDPQANLSRSITDDLEPGLYDALSGNSCEIKEIQNNLSLLAGDIKLATLEKSLIGEIDGYTRLKELLEHESFNRFEYILIDTPPSFGVLSINALTSAGYLIIPMSPALYTLQGTNDLISTVSKVRKSLNPELKLLGVIINAYDQIPVITRQIRAEIEASFGDKVFSTSLSKSIKIEEAIAGRIGVISHKKSKVCREIEQIGDELISRAETAC